MIKKCRCGNKLNDFYSFIQYRQIYWDNQYEPEEFWSVYCAKCQRIGPKRSTKKTAIIAWNKMDDLICGK